MFSQGCWLGCAALKASGRRDTPTLLMGACRVRSRSSYGLTLHSDCAGHCAGARNGSGVAWRFTVREALAGPHLDRVHPLGCGVVSIIDLAGRCALPPQEPGNAPPTAYHHVVLRERCPSCPFPRNTSHPLCQSATTHPPALGGVRSPKAVDAAAGCSHTPLYRRAVAPRPGPRRSIPRRLPRRVAAAVSGGRPKTVPIWRYGGFAITGPGQA